jgi:enoyl-CoA hydratase
MIRGETHGAVTVLTLEHGKANALDTELCRGLAAALDELVREGVPAVVLTGRGSIFSAGVDLFRVVDGGAAYVADFLPALSELFLALVELPRPLVAAVNGHAIAGGCLVACACDRRLMAAGRGRVGVPELRVGVPFPTLALEILRTATGTAGARELATRGHTVGPEEAEQLGLVDRVTPAETLLDEACAEAERLAALPADAFALTKRQLWTPALDAYHRHGAGRDAEVVEQWSREASRQAIRRYLDETVGRKG